MEGEGAIGVGGGEVLGADGGDGVEVGEVVDLEVSHLAVGEGGFGLGADDLGACPVGEAVGALGAGGVGLGGEFGHAVFVMDGGIGDVEEGGELLVEVGFGEGAGGAFVASGFEELGA